MAGEVQIKNRGDRMLIKGKPFKRKALHKPTLNLHLIIVQNFYHLFSKDKETNKFHFLKKETKITYVDKGVPFKHPMYPYVNRDVSESKTIHVNDEWGIFEKE